MINDAKYQPPLGRNVVSKDFERLSPPGLKQITVTRKSDGQQPTIDCKVSVAVTEYQFLRNARPEAYIVCQFATFFLCLGDTAKYKLERNALRQKDKDEILCSRV